MSRFVPHHPADYHETRLSRVSKEAEDDFLNDPNPYRTDPCLDLSEADYRATTEMDGDFLVIQTTGVERLPFARLGTLWFGSTLIGIFVLALLIAIPESLARGDRGQQTLITLFCVPIVLTMLHFFSSDRRNAADWACNGTWKMWFSPRQIGYLRKRGEAEEEKHSLPVLGTRVVPNEPKTKITIREPEWFTDAHVVLIDGEIRYFFPCASDRERDWLLAEIERFRATNNRTSNASEVPAPATEGA